MSVSAERRKVIPFRPSASAFALEESVADQTTFSPNDPGASAIEARLAAIQGTIDAFVQSSVEEPAQEYFRLPPLHTRRVRVRIRNREQGTIRLILDDNQ